MDKENSVKNEESTAETQSGNDNELKQMENPVIIENLLLSTTSSEMRKLDIAPVLEVSKPESIEPTSQDNNDIKCTPNSLSGGLGMLAQYDSDSADTDTEQPAAEYRNQTVNLDTDTDSSSDSDSSCIEIASKQCLERAKKALDKMISDGSDDDEDDGENTKTHKRKPPKVKGELLLDELPPIEDLHITVPEEECVELGKVHSIVEQLVLVSAMSNSVLVDLDTVLFLNKGKQVLGEVFDVLGQVAEPLYCVRFNSNEQIKEKNINVGDVVYVAPKTEYTQFIILSSLMQARGSDASWENDVEPPPRYLDYSDDEEERQARSRARNKDRRTDSENVVEPKRTMNTITEDMDTASSTSSIPAYRPASNTQQYAQRGRAARGRGRGSNNNNTHAFNQGHALPHAGSWHSNYYQGPMPPNMYYGPQPPYPYPYPMPPPMMPYAPYPQHYPGYPPRYNNNNAPAPPGNSYDENNSM